MLGPRKPLGGQYVGAGGALATPEQVAQQKQIAAALLQQAGDTSPVGHWSAALNRGLQGWLGGRDMYRARQSESEGTSKALERFNARNSGAGAASRVAEALAGGVAAGQPVSGDESGFLASLVASESGGNWNALNKEGYGGRLQFGAARLADAARAGVIPAAITGAEFSRLSPEQQMAVEQWHFNDIDQQAERMGLGQYVGQTVAGIPITREAIRGMAHLGGIGGAAKFLQSGGRYNPADSNGTSLADYALRHGGAGAGISQAPAASNVSEIATLLADPWLPKDAKAVLQAEMNQQMQMQNAAYEMQLQQQDPMRQLEMQRAQLELDQLRNPGRPKPIEVGGVLLDAETFQPIFDSRSAPGAQSAAGKIQADLSAGLITPEQAELAFSKLGNQTNVTTNLGGDKFAEEVGKNQAAAFNEMSASGFSAAQNLGNLARLESLLAQGPSGASAALQNLAANYGIDVGNAGPLQAANALIQAMIPAQRPAGSGPMSDKDIEMFKASLPRLINSPEGNALIIQTLRGIAQYDMQRAEIADRAMLPAEDPNHLPRNEASKMLRQLRSPLSEFGKSASQFKEPEQDPNAIPQGVDPADWEYMTPEERALFQ